MTWWAWTLLWVVLVVGAGLVLYLAVRRLFRQGMALARELSDAADLLAEVTRALEPEPVEAGSTGAGPAGAGSVDAADIHPAARSEPAGTSRRPSSTRASPRRRRPGATSQDVR